MGAICCLEKAGLPLHQDSSQNDGRMVQTFSKVLKKEEVGQIKTLEVQEGSFYKRKFKCALKRTACLYKKKNRHSTGFQRSKRQAQNSKTPIQKSKRQAQNSKTPIQKSKRQAQKSEKHLAFPDALAPVTRKLSFAEITGNLSKRRSQISKRRQSFSTASSPVICTLNFAQITGNLSKIFGEGEST
ncbi:hypothetical protein PS2_031097 [Malus domestica]